MSSNPDENGPVDTDPEGEFPTAPAYVYVLIFGWAILFGVLLFFVEWPGKCDHSGRYLVGAINVMSCSPELLDGGVSAMLLFACIWAMPALIVGAIIWRLGSSIFGTAK